MYRHICLHAFQITPLHIYGFPKIEVEYILPIPPAKHYGIIKLWILKSLVGDLVSICHIVIIIT